MTKEEKEKAIDALKISTPVMAMTQEEFNDYIQTLNKVMDWLEQEPKTGHWIRITNGAMKEKYICSECGRQIEDDGIEGLLSIKYPYCHCGAKMVDPQESEGV